jgi:hypothetical protein
MERHYIEFDNKEYEVPEPTIELWNRLNTLKELQSEEEFTLSIISLSTGLTLEQVREADYFMAWETANYLTDYFLKEGEKFYPTFEFRGVNYKFIDLENLTFGEFIDIDTHLSQPAHKRQSELNLLMALLYREVDDDGKVVKYDGSKVKERAELFRHLPIKYLRGSLNFFFSFRKHITRKYPLIFTTQDEVVEIQDKPGFESFWGWYASLVYLSGEDILKVQEIAAKNLLEVFNFLTYMKDLNMLRERELNKQIKGL